MATTTRRALFEHWFKQPATLLPDGHKALAPTDPLQLLINRSSFGLRSAEYQAAQALGFDGWLERQLNPESIDVSGLESALARLLPTLSMSNAALIADARATQNSFRSFIELRSATFLRQFYSGQQLYEVMVEFWSNHFSVEHISGPIRQFKTPDDRAIRSNAMGSFRDLLNANARSPAMLFYLDNYVNVVSGPQENYARELLELHTLGVNGGYTEDDVKNVARAFTGWTINGRGDYEFIFNGLVHDFEAKTFLGQAMPAGQGVEDGQQVLDILASHPSTANLIATKLVRRFVADNPPATLVDAVAQVFLSTGGDVRSMLRTIFSSSEFAASGDQKVKRPAEFVMSAMRVLDLQFQGDAPIRRINAYLEQLNQLPFMWPAPNGYPDVQGYWINTTAWLTRWNFAFAVAENTLAPGLYFNPATLIGSANKAAEVVDVLADRLLHRPLLDEDRALLIELVAGGAPVDARIDARTLQLRVRELTAVLLASPYFHFR
ncbi:MAG: DUF1800 domain-containing protein [Xanthomonadales bacterium]|nr:DUF1800 domain-containing protein [Xanthomonadales bacterium]